MLDRLTRPWVLGLSRLEEVEDMRRACCRPQSEELVVCIGERPAAADRHEARVADLREDHALTPITRPVDFSVSCQEPLDGAAGTGRITWSWSSPRWPCGYSCAGSVTAMANLLSLDDIRAAARTITGHVERTPTVASPGMSALLGVPVTLKLELLQRSGSFKPRGVAMKLLGLTPVERDAGVVAVSGGNHGIAVAEVANGMGVRATVVMAKTAPPRSIDRIRAAGAELRLTEDMAGAFTLLEELVADGMTLVHPFDDPTVLAGQGTVGLELAEDAPPLTDVLVSIGGGALISGVAVAIKALMPDVRIWGVETEGADAMARALAAGEPVDIAPSSIASTLSAPHVSQLTLDHVRALVEEVFVVPDAEAAGGMVAFAEEAKMWVEPATGCLVPAAAQVIERGRTDVSLGFVVCGGNVTQRDVRGWFDRLL